MLGFLDVLNPWQTTFWPKVRKERVGAVRPNDPRHGVPERTRRGLALREGESGTERLLGEVQSGRVRDLQNMIEQTRQLSGQ